MASKPEGQKALTNTAARKERALVKLLKGVVKRRPSVHVRKVDTITIYLSVLQSYMAHLGSYCILKYPMALRSSKALPLWRCSFPPPRRTLLLPNRYYFHTRLSQIFPAYLTILLAGSLQVIAFLAVSGTFRRYL
jgi:hypothetical protein